MTSSKWRQKLNFHNDQNNWCLFESTSKVTKIGIFTFYNTIIFHGEITILIWTSISPWIFVIKNKVNTLIAIIFSTDSKKRTYFGLTSIFNFAAIFNENETKNFKNITIPKCHAFYIFSYACMKIHDIFKKNTFSVTSNFLVARSYLYLPVVIYC